MNLTYWNVCTSVQEHLNKDIHCSTVCESTGLETIYLSIIRGMAKLIIIYLVNHIHCACWKPETRKSPIRGSVSLGWHNRVKSIDSGAIDSSSAMYDLCDFGKLLNFSLYHYFLICKVGMIITVSTLDGWGEKWMNYNDEPGMHPCYMYFENAKSLEFKLG